MFVDANTTRSPKAHVISRQVHLGKRRGQAGATCAHSDNHQRWCCAREARDVRALGRQGM